MKDYAENTKQAYNTYAHKFAETRAGKIPWQEFALSIPALEAHTSQHVLDLGCGAGRMIPFIQNHTHIASYMGIDFSSALLGKAHALYGNHPEYVFHEATFQHMHLLEDTFSYACAIASFHHVLEKNEQQEFLAKVRKSLTQEAHFFITNWNLWDEPAYASMQEEGTSLFHIPLSDGLGEPCLRTYYAFTEEELRALYEEAGFTIISQETGRNFSHVLRLC